jgi:shikimate kinase
VILPSETAGCGRAVKLVALTGFMGAGKSTVGRELASALGSICLDLDDEVEKSQQRPIRDLFRDFGEPGFREIESAALRELLNKLSGNTVVALGGGTFVQPNNVDLLTRFGARVVFLDAPAEELFARCLAATAPEENLRPLAADPDAFFSLYKQRQAHYRAAHVVVATSGKTPAEIAREIAIAL